MRKMKYILIFLAVTAALLLFFTEAERGEEKEVATAPSAVKKSTVQAQKNEPGTVETTTESGCTVVAKKSTKKAWKCPECGAPAESDSLCKHCGEPYTRLWGYGFVRCWKTADGIEWETETAPACGCTPDEFCNFCRDKVNHGWKSSGEVEYYEYSDFLKEKGLRTYEAVYPDKPKKKVEKTVKVQEEKKNVQDENRQNIQQPSSGETEASGEIGQLENVGSCNGDDNGCGTVDNMDNVKDEKEEAENEIYN